MQSYRELRVWKLGMDLVEKVYQVTNNFPSSELYSLTSQLRRASISIPSNIAEGFGRQFTKEYLHHLAFAYGSLAEVETQLELSFRLHYLNEEEYSLFVNECEALGKQLMNLQKSLRLRAENSK